MRIIYANSGLAGEGGERQKQARENNGGGKGASAREQWRKYSRDAADRLGRRPFLFYAAFQLVMVPVINASLQPPGRRRRRKKQAKVYQLDTLRHCRGKTR